MLVAGADCARVAAFTVETELPNSTRRCSPVAVVTTSANFTIADSREKSTVTLCPAETMARSHSPVSRLASEVSEH